MSCSAGIVLLRSRRNAPPSCRGVPSACLRHLRASPSTHRNAFGLGFARWASTSTKRRVLVVGGGPAGSTTAFWLGKAGFEVLVAERNTGKPYGQGLDITGSALDVVRKMGLEREIRAGTTKEGGFALIDDKGEEIAAFGAPSGEGEATFVTQEIEIMRGELTSILARAAEALPNVTYRYGCGVSEIRQSELSATALLSDSGRAEEFTAIVGADGAMSKVRRLAFPSEAQQDCIKPVDTYIAYFSIPGAPAYDVPNSHLQHGDKGRAIWMRPIDEAGTRTSCLFLITAESPELQHAAESADQEQQKAVLDNMFKDFDGIGPRAVRGMHGCADFHFARIVQVKLDTWHNGRIGLVGDAAYCPSPLTGQGTTLALLGAYILAGEMLRHPEDPRGAFTAYERQIGDFVSKCQQIPFGGKAPRLALPQTTGGIWTLRTLFRLIMSTRLWKLFQFGEDPMKIKLPQYEWR